VDKKNYEVTLVYSYRIAVEGAESEQKAIQYAMEESGFDMGNCYDQRAREAQDEFDWNSIVRHADQVGRDD
jgi:hypothetical protein